MNGESLVVGNSGQLTARPVSSAGQNKRSSAVNATVGVGNAGVGRGTPPGHPPVVVTCVLWTSRR